MRRTQPRRDWSDANEQKRAPCRVCGHVPVELAHTIGRKHDERRGSVLYVHPDSVVPLCVHHHRAHDLGRGALGDPFDLLPHLTLDEQLDAVRRAGGIESARRRLAPSCYRKDMAA